MEERSNRRGNLSAARSRCAAGCARAIFWKSKRMNGNTEREQSGQKNSRTRVMRGGNWSCKWAREELNLRPHAYQPDKSDVKVRRPVRKSLTDSAICRDSLSVLPCLAGINGQHNGQQGYGHRRRPGRRRTPGGLRQSRLKHVGTSVPQRGEGPATIADHKLAALLRCREWHGRMPPTLEPTRLSH